MDFQEIQERMHGGRLYYCTDPALQAEQADWLELLYDFNQTRPSQGE